MVVAGPAGCFQVKFYGTNPGRVVDPDPGIGKIRTLVVIELACSKHLKFLPGTGNQVILVKVLELPYELQ